jgi:hypothetical protein
LPLAQPQGHQGIATGQQHRQQSVGEGAADDAVQIVQPVAQDGGADGRRQDRWVEPARQRRQGIGAEGQRGQVDDGQQGDQGGAQCHPAQLLAFDVPGATEADHQRGSRHYRGGDADGERREVGGQQLTIEGAEVERAVDLLGRPVGGPGEHGHNQ